MAGHHPWRELRDADLTPGARVDVTAWATARRDPAFQARERRAARLLDGARDRAAYAEARHTVREVLGLDPDAVPHDPSPGVCVTTGDVPAGGG